MACGRRQARGPWGRRSREGRGQGTEDPAKGLDRIPEVVDHGRNSCLETGKLKFIRENIYRALTVCRAHGQERRKEQELSAGVTVSVEVEKNQYFLHTLLCPANYTKPCFLFCFFVTYFHF